MRAVYTITMIITIFISFKSLAQTESDSSAIFKTMANWNKAWETRDAKLAVQDYTEDADWTNAFGMRRVGRDSIQVLLEYVFSLPFVMAGQSNYEYHDLKFLNSDIAILRSRNIRNGQKLPNGQIEEPRRINHLRFILNDQING
jgi:uncharacterized protein (TIGR02246 family)